MDGMVLAVLALLAMSRWPFEGEEYKIAAAFTATVTFLYSFLRVCALDGQDVPCGHRFRARDSEQIRLIAALRLCRYRCESSVVERIP
jgi:hypothetical protein